jgi:hypothetical protein
MHLVQVGLRMLLASSLVFVEVDVTVFEDDVNLLPGSVLCQSVGSFVLEVNSMIRGTLNG